MSGQCDFDFEIFSFSTVDSASSDFAAIFPDYSSFLTHFLLWDF
jgi:hypothetical protein